MYVLPEDIWRFPEISGREKWALEKKTSDHNDLKLRWKSSPKWANSQMRTMMLVYKNLQNWVIYGVNVGIHTSTMEHMGIVCHNPIDCHSSAFLWQGHRDPFFCPVDIFCTVLNDLWLYILLSQSVSVRGLTSQFSLSTDPSRRSSLCAPQITHWQLWIRFLEESYFKQRLSPERGTW